MAEVLATVRGDRRVVLDAYASRMNLESARGRSSLIDQLTLDYSSMVDTSVAGAVEMPGATRLLEELRRDGVSVYLSSATPLGSLQKILEQRSWIDRFDGVYGHPLTKVEALRDIVARTGYSESDLAVVGDGEDDRESARVVGCAYFPVGEARGCDRRSERIYSLPELTTVFTNREKVK